MISSLNALTVFDPDGENHEEYKKIHKSYKDMVRKLYFFLLLFAQDLLFGNNLETSNILNFFKCLSLVFNLSFCRCYKTEFCKLLPVNFS